jgi:outer membrane lipoprotein SlyB
MVPAGATLNVRLNEKISTDDVRSGDRWTGTLTQSVYSIPAGAVVSGVVRDVAQGTHNEKARIDLAVRDVNIDGRIYALQADAPPIVAGTKRAKKIGAIVGGAAVGALAGNAIGGKKGTVIGGVLGGAAGYGLTRHALRTMQLKSGTVLQFTTRSDMVARRY